MKQLHKIKPYSDNQLAWNENTQQYELTLEYCKDIFESNYVDDEVYQKRIRKNSRKIYRYIQNHVHSYNLPLVTRLINETEEGRAFMREILTTQMDADIETGFNDLSSTPAINLSNGQVIDRNELYRNQICVDAEQVFDDSHKYFGFRIGYQQPFPPIYFVFFK